jgi:hypothetical protein
MLADHLIVAIGSNHASADRPSADLTILQRASTFRAAMYPDEKMRFLTITYGSPLSGTEMAVPVESVSLSASLSPVFDRLLLPMGCSGRADTVNPITECPDP